MFVCSGWLATATGQGTFQNLGFESANPGSLTTFVSVALPGWSAYVGGHPFGNASYNGTPLSGSYVGVFDSNAPSYMPRPILGNYSAYIAAGYGGDTWLTQSGLIDASAKSIRFRTDLVTNPYNNTFSFAINGQTLPLYVATSGPNYNVWTADVEHIAGTVAEIRFSLRSYYGPGNIGAYMSYLDNIAFSPIAVPEPATSYLLSILAAVLLVTRRIFRRKPEPLPVRLDQRCAFHLLPQPKRLVSGQ
jgi:hypothetical protein